MRHLPTKLTLAAATVAFAAGGIGAAVGSGSAGAAPTVTTFPMVRSAGAEAASCLADAGASVKVTRAGITETLDVTVTGLPAKTDFDLFVTQVPNNPFGVSWYQGDLETDRTGHGHGVYKGRFSVETFAVAPSVAPAPSVHSAPIPDAATNPPFGPIHTYHLGLWFNSPADAVKAGCPSTVTPFNGEHSAGVQALSTRQAPNDFGPLRNVIS